MKFDNKKIGIILLAAAAVVGVSLLFVFLSKSSKKEGGADDQMRQNILAALPGADVTEIPDSKLDAYDRSRGKGTIEDYFNDMDNRDPFSDEEEVTPVGEGLKGGGKKSQFGTTYEDLFGDALAQSGNMADRQAERERARNEQINQMTTQSMDMMRMLIESQNKQQADAMAKEGEAQEEPAAPAVPERDKIDVERVKVVRSGGISSMDDEFGGVSSSGISSLDGDDRVFANDEAYPFKCMFVRQEKLKSSQRVSVRLLEDIVIEGQLVRANTHLNAVCSINDRIDLKVSNIEIGGRIINLDFEAYDNDGTKGIYAPDLNNDTQLEDALKQAGVSGVRRRMSTAVGQMVQDVVSAGSMVITGVGKDRTVTIPAGYQFYLVKSKNNSSRL